MASNERRVARGIYRTASGWRVYVRVGGTLKPKRIYDPQHHLGLVDVKQRRDDWRTDARRLAQMPSPVEPGTFAADVREKYLPAVRAMRTYRERVRHMDLWVAVFGARAATAIEPWAIAAQRDRWLTEGPRLVCQRGGTWVEVAAPLSASQVNKRLRALENFYTVVYPGRPNPVRAAGEAREPETEARGLPYSVVEAILAQLPDRGCPRDGLRPPVSLSKLRLRVIAYTGLSHGELRGVTAEDLHLEEPVPWVWVAGRHKGRGTEGSAHPLTRQGVAAFRALVKADGLGPFHAESLNRAFKRAAAHVGFVGVRAYDLRHSFATEVLDKTDGNIGATQLVMRQKDPRTTLRYAKRAIEPAKLAVIQKVQARGAFSVTARVTPRRKRRAKPA